MSTLQNQQPWLTSIQKETLDSKYEKCRNITEEIYKRINITFQIKKLETTVECDGSEHSDQIDSNELSNVTDLFACDKTDSLPSSTEGEKQTEAASEKLTNINNNNIKKSVNKRPKKKFRKRIKKRQPSKQTESDGSSDEALPLSRMLGVETRKSPPCVMGVPNIVILTKDVKPEILSPEKQKQSKETKSKKETKSSPAIDSRTAQEIKDKINAQEVKDKIEPLFAEAIEKASAMLDESVIGKADLKICGLCELSFHGEKGLRHHMAVSHITSPREMTSIQRAKEEKRV